MTLWHFTCTHGVKGITESGLVIPLGQHPGFDVSRLPPGFEWMADVAWFTDLDRPNRYQVGLTREAYVRCNRLEHRFRVTDPSTLQSWLMWQRGKVSRETLLDLHFGSAMPGRWFVSEEPVPVTLQDHV